MRKTESPADVQRWFDGVIRKLWPVAVGSLSLRKGPVYARIALRALLARGIAVMHFTG